MFRSIRFRLAAWYTLVITLTFLCFSTIVYQYLEETLSSSLDHSLTSEMNWIVSRLEKQLARGDHDRLVQDDIFEHAQFYPIKEFIEIWRPSDSLFYHSPNLFGDTVARYVAFPRDSSWTITTVRHLREFDVRVIARRSSFGVVFVAMPTESAIAPLSHLLRIFAWLGPLLVGVAIGGGAYLARKSLAKVNDVIRIAKSITADRLSDRIPERKVEDEIGELISTFNKMISRLDISFQQMKQFSADASHELKTPLSVMRTQLETALATNVSPDELETIVVNCLDETIRMSSIIESLLLLARADTGKDVIVREPVQLEKLVREVFDESTILASPKRIGVNLKLMDEATVLGDEQRLHQMLLNLIDNAIKHNRINGNIEISLIRENGNAKIRIADTGIGIPEEEIPRIFDRFYRVDRARSRQLGGSGLGLSIVRWVVAAHGGSINVKSRVDKGSEFEVVLPVVT